MDDPQDMWDHEDAVTFQKECHKKMGEVRRLQEKVLEAKQLLRQAQRRVVEARTVLQTFLLADVRRVRRPGVKESRPDGGEA